MSVVRTLVLYRCAATCLETEYPGSDNVVRLVTLIPPSLAESASRSRFESIGAGFPLRAGNSFVLI